MKPYRDSKNTIDALVICQPMNPVRLKNSGCGLMSSISVRASTMPLERRQKERQRERPWIAQPGKSRKLCGWGTLFNPNFHNLKSSGDTLVTGLCSLTCLLAQPKMSAKCRTLACALVI
jgi:hypothetical protein